MPGPGGSTPALPRRSRASAQTKQRKDVQAVSASVVKEFYRKSATFRKLIRETIDNRRGSWKKPSVPGLINAFTVHRDFSEFVDVYIFEGRPKDVIRTARTLIDLHGYDPTRGLDYSPTGLLVKCRAEIRIFPQRVIITQRCFYDI